MVHRSEYYKGTEEVMQKKKKERDENLREIQSVIDFENNILREEHQFEIQIGKTILFIQRLQKDFPKATFKIGHHKSIDHGFLRIHLSKLMVILLYLKSEEIESVHILRDVQSPIEIEKEGRKLKIQKKHLKKLSAKLNLFVNEIKYFLKSGIKDLQITTEMRKHLKEFYEEILRIYLWYAELFKKEAKK